MLLQVEFANISENEELRDVVQWLVERTLQYELKRFLGEQRIPHPIIPNIDFIDVKVTALAPMSITYHGK